MIPSTRAVPSRRNDVQKGTRLVEKPLQADRLAKVLTSISTTRYLSMREEEMKKLIGDYEVKQKTEDGEKGSLDTILKLLRARLSTREPLQNLFRKLYGHDNFWGDLGHELNNDYHGNWILDHGDLRILTIKDATPEEALARYIASVRMDLHD